MKRFILAMCIMAVMIGVGGLSLWHSRYSSNVLTAQVVYIQNHALDDREASVREVKQLEQMWTQRQTWLLHHMRHHMMDEIGKVMSRTRVYAEEDERALLRAALSELQWLFHRIYDEEQVNLDNIL